MIRRTLPLITITLLWLVFISLPAMAQSSQTEQAKTNAPAQAQQEQPSIDSADLAITANVTARELKFEVVPNPTVTFPGKPKRNTLWEAERQNLPAQVQPGVTYRNIGIRLKIVSVFADIDRIVSEALGETPVTDGVPPPPAMNQPPATSPPATSPPPQTSSSATKPAGEGRPR